MFTLIFSDPNLLPRLQVDKGAIKFILSGANIMAPGLTSPGARMDIDLPADTVVVSVKMSRLYIIPEQVNTGAMLNA